MGLYLLPWPPLPKTVKAYRGSFIIAADGSITYNSGVLESVNKAGTGVYELQLQSSVFVVNRTVVLANAIQNGTPGMWCEVSLSSGVCTVHVLRDATTLIDEAFNGVVYLDP